MRRRGTATAVLLAAALLGVPACRKGSGRETDFVRAVAAGDEARVREMLEKEPDLVTAVDTGPHGNDYVRPLHEAIRKENLAMVRLLLEKGVAPNAPEASGVTPLHEWAKGNGSPEILDALLAKKADLEGVDDSGRRPLHVAARRRLGADVVERLLARGAKLEGVDGTGMTPLLAAVAETETRGGAVLCAHGADLAARDKMGNGVAELLARAVSSPDHAASARFYGPGGGCSQLIARFRRDGSVPLAVTNAVVNENGCAAGDMRACQDLGLAYSSGDGVEADETRAVELYAKACAGGRGFSCGKLAYRLANGKGVAQDLPRAAALYAQACDAGVPSCCRNLGYLVEAGQGTAKDPSRARALFEKACAGKDEESCAHLKELPAPR